MKSIKLYLFALIFSFPIFINAQVIDSIPKESTSGFKDYYPINVKPSVSYLSSMNNKESILFDAKPIVYYSFFNNMRKVMQYSTHKPSFASYVTFQPHIRMYDETSQPVKTPSYRVLVGWQHLIKTKNDNFIAYAVESGHYSNGQSGCAFHEEHDDESTNCNLMYDIITPETDLSNILNRKNGNFSTNTTKVSVNYRFNNINSNDKPYQVFSITGSWELYHYRMFGFIDKGGYSKSDIKIYGRNRFGLEGEYIHTYKGKFRYSIGQKFELIQGAHKSVEPLRSETTGTIYPFAKDIGFFVSYFYGHDNYNYRFVDSGSQINIGVTWDWFTPFQIKRAQKIRNSK